MGIHELSSPLTQGPEDTDRLIDYSGLCLV